MKQGALIFDERTDRYQPRSCLANSILIRSIPSWR